MQIADNVCQKLNNAREKAIINGELPSLDRINGFYTAFRGKFGPEVLAGFQGRDLLMLMHDRREKDCLAYWLEFKNDEEFNTYLFGGIGGGSALKYEVFQQGGDGPWMGRDKHNVPTMINEKLAISMAVRQRDQILAGVELLKSMPKDGGRTAYEELQQLINERMPNTGHLAWVHKYLRLLFPELVDGFHIRPYQDYNLLKLLILPPEIQGKFVCAGDFVQLAQIFDLPLTHLTHLLNSLHGAPVNYWRVGTREGDTRNSHWEEMLRTRCIAVGWADLGDLSDIGANDREKLKERFASIRPDTTPQIIGRQSSQIMRFLHSMKEGDIVLACDGATVLGIGRIAGDPHHEDGHRFPHRRDVEWLGTGKWKMPSNEGLRTTIHQMKNHINLLEVEKRLLSAGPIIIQPKLSTLAGIPGQIQEALERKGQVILHGPPGTGKTFWAEHTAVRLAARGWFEKSYEELTPEEQAILTPGANTGKAVRMCCFHPAYGYEDFIEGFRPRTVNDRMTFTQEDSLFKRLCREATANSDRPYYLIIDEINRGDIPRIFGELLMALENDKRGKVVTLPVSGDPLAVPKNLFVIGTMNTADRSIALLDTALRRRFAFMEPMPDSRVWGAAEADDLPLGPWLDALNAKVLEHAGRNARNLQVGHSYLMHRGKPLEKWHQFAKALRQDIIPLLCEYFYENYTILAKVLGKALVDAEKQRIRWELFDPARQDELAEALKAMDDSIATSTEAVQADLDREQSEAENADDEQDDQ